MCTIILLQKVFENYPLIVAANRDEAFDRPALGPRILNKEHQIIGAQDQVSKGTWLAYSKKTNSIAAITNESDHYNPNLKSRGHLVSNALMNNNFNIDSSLYNKFNLIVSTIEKSHIYFGHGQSKMYSKDLKSGISIITNNFFSLKSSIKQDFLRQETRKIVEKYYDNPNFTYIKEELFALLSSHDILDVDDTLKSTVCIHDENWGTRSSTIMALGDSLEYWHSEDAPCKSKLKNYNYLME